MQTDIYIDINLWVVCTLNIGHHHDLWDHRIKLFVIPGQFDQRNIQRRKIKQEKSSLFCQLEIQILDILKQHPSTKMYLIFVLSSVADPDPVFFGSSPRSGKKKLIPDLSLLKKNQIASYSCFFFLSHFTHVQFCRKYCFT